MEKKPDFGRKWFIASTVFFILALAVGIQMYTNGYSIWSIILPAVMIVYNLFMVKACNKRLNNQQDVKGEK